MSVEAIAVVLHHSQSSGTDKVVLLGIANHDGDGGSWPTITTLMKYSRMAERTVQSSIRKLEALGEIVVHTNDGGNHHTDPRYRPNRYEITVRCPPECDGTTNHREVQPTAPLDDSGVQSDALRGAVQRDLGVQPTAPEPSLQPSLEPSIVGDRFDEFWKLYPRKEGKAAAQSKWTTLLRDKCSPDEIIAGLQRRVRWWKMSRTEQRFIPHPATWLNQRRWLDDLPPVERNATSSATAAADRRDHLRAEVDEAIERGNPDLAWEIICRKARADGNEAFVRAASLLEQRGDEAIMALTGLSFEDVAAIRTMRERIHAAATGATVELRYSLTEGEDDDATTGH